MHGLGRRGEAKVLVDLLEHEHGSRRHPVVKRSGNSRESTRPPKQGAKNVQAYMTGP
jgi:hypothetical protein